MSRYCFSTSADSALPEVLSELFEEYTYLRIKLYP